MAYSIETLNLSGIGLTILPDELKWFFITVKTFNLSRNRLSTIPQWIEKFEHLEKLNLSDNPDLKELPFSIFSLKEHCVINLFGTPLHSRFPQGELSIENMKQTCLSII